jgi:glycine/D-amino acid oxidase-like deaminating enzyme
MSASAPSRDFYDAIISGGGFFGCCLALSMMDRYPRLLILERESGLLTRASFGNQARVHNGYHYPRSLITALRSAFNYPRFIADFEDCVDRTFLQVYAIARQASRVSAYQYKKFCQNVGIPLQPASGQVASLFNPDLIEEAFSVEECAFDGLRLRDKLRAGIEEAGIEVAYGIEAKRISHGPAGSLRIETSDGAEVCSERVWNCAYSQINHLLISSSLPPLPLKHEIAEIALIRVPPQLERIGITVMDGPFFSTMPFPTLGLHSLTHVTYTPHESWSDLEHYRCPPRNPSLPSKSIFMLRDAQRYVPALQAATCAGSLFETKTVLVRNEVDDGRPILCRRDYGLKNFSVIMGAKIDNIYDILKALDAPDCFPWSKHEFDTQTSR